MPPIGQCAICLSSLSSSETYAIRTCGHTFHEKCIKHWLKEGKACSSCRKKANENDVIKLYIQETGLNDTFASQNLAAEQLAETERKFEDLTNTHKKVVQEKTRIDSENRRLNKELSKLQQEASNVDFLRAQLMSLEDAYKNYQATEQKLKEAESKLKASIFYELLTSKGKSEEEYNNFVDSNGILNGDAFLTQAMKENKKLKKQLAESQNSLKKLEKDYDAEKKISLQRKDAISKLSEEVKALRKAAEKKEAPPTPNPRLINILNHSPPPNSRKSLGFSFESPVFPRDVVESAQPKRTRKRVIIDDDDDEDDAKEENTPPAAVSNKKKSTPKKSKKAFSFSSDEEDDASFKPPSNEVSFNVAPAVSRFTRQNSSAMNLRSKFGTTINDKRPALVPATKTTAKTKKIAITRRATAPTLQKVPTPPSDDSLDDSIVCLD